MTYPQIGIWFPLRCKIPFTIKLKGTANFDSAIVIGNLPGKESLSGRFLFIQNESAKAKFGKHLFFGSGLEIYQKANSYFSIGQNSYFTGKCHIECENKILIGNDCAISWGCTIIDSDHHAINYPGKQVKENSVRIGNNVLIGCNTTILKGTDIGDGSVVAAGSVVFGKFENNVLVGGNPAKVLKRNVTWKK